MEFQAAVQNLTRSVFLEIGLRMTSVPTIGLRQPYLFR